MFAPRAAPLLWLTPPSHKVLDVELDPSPASATRLLSAGYDGAVEEQARLDLTTGLTDGWHDDLTPGRSRDLDLLN